MPRKRARACGSDAMPRILFFYLARRVFVAAIVVQIALTLPVVLTALFHQLPPAALRGGLVWPALVGTVPTVTYIALPMAIGVAAALEFSRMSAEGMMAVLYSLRLSIWSICRPALACAAVFTAVGYILSCVVAPANVGTMHDVINVIRHTLNHRMLDPGQFYSFEEQQRTIYLERWQTPDVATGVFIRQFSPEKKQEETITAARAEFRRNEASVVMILSNGTIQSRADNAEHVRVAHFDEYAISLPMQGTTGLPPRPWKGVFELPIGEFLRYGRLAVYDPRIYAEWGVGGDQALRRAVPGDLAHPVGHRARRVDRQRHGASRHRLERGHRGDPDRPCRRAHRRGNAGAAQFAAMGADPGDRAGGDGGGHLSHPVSGAGCEIAGPQPRWALVGGPGLSRRGPSARAAEHRVRRVARRGFRRTCGLEPADLGSQERDALGQFVDRQRVQHLPDLVSGIGGRRLRPGFRSNGSSSRDIIPDYRAGGARASVLR